MADGTAAGDLSMALRVVAMAAVRTAPDPLAVPWVQKLLAAHPEDLAVLTQAYRGASPPWVSPETRTDCSQWSQWGAHALPVRPPAPAFALPPAAGARTPPRSAAEGVTARGAGIH